MLLNITFSEESSFFGTPFANLPLEILCLILDSVFQDPTEEQAEQHFTDALQAEEAWAAQHAPLWSTRMVFSNWTSQRRRKSLDAAKHRIARELVLKTRLTSKAWADYGAEILVKCSHDWHDHPKRPYSCLDFALNQQALDQFFTIAKNPILARAVRYMTIKDDNSYFLPWSTTALDHSLPWRADRLRCQDQSEQDAPSTTSSEMPEFYSTILEHKQAAMTQYSRLMADNCAEFMGCVKNLNCVDVLGYDLAPNVQEVRLHYKALHPQAYRDHEKYLYILPEALLKMGVPPKNMFQQGKTWYLADADADGNNSIRDPRSPNPPLHTKELFLQAVTCREYDRYDDLNLNDFNWNHTSEAHDVTKSVLLRNDREDAESDKYKDFSFLCNQVLRGLQPQRTLSWLRLECVKVSLPLLSSLLTTWAPRSMPNELVMLNVRAESRTDWRLFLDQVRETREQHRLYYRRWHIKECPHPATIGASKEWEYINDIVTEFGGDGAIADIIGYVFPRT